jgi:hypothetical protein
LTNGGVHARLASIEDTPFVQQQGMDDTPPVLLPRPESHKWRPLLLKLVEEPQCFFGGGRRRLLSLGPDPAVPFLKKKGFPFVTSHRLRVLDLERERFFKNLRYRAGRFGQAGSVQEPTGVTPGRRMATAVPSTYKANMLKSA